MAESALAHAIQTQKNAPSGRFSFAYFSAATLVALPLIGWLGTSHFMPWVSWHAELPFFLATFAAAWVALIRKRQVRAIPLPAIAWPLLVLSAVAPLQLLAGQITFGGEVVVVELYLLLGLICAVLGYASLRHHAPDPAQGTPSPIVQLLAYALLVGGVSSTAVACAQALDLWTSTNWIVRMDNLRRPGGNLAQSNHLATLLLMAMASVIYLQRLRQIGNVVAVATLLFFGAALALTESRTGLLSLIALLFWWLWKQPIIAPQVQRWCAGAVVALSVTMFLSWPFLFDAIQLAHVGSSGSGVVQSRLVEGSLRFQIWPQLIEALAMRPWTGWGIREVAQAHNAVAHAYPISEPYSYSHNLILDLALWIGLPLTALLTLMISVWVWCRARATRTPLTWYGLAVALPVAVHAMLEFPHAYAYFLAPVMLALGAVEGSLGIRPWLRLGRKTAAGLLLVTTVLMAWSVVEYVQVEEDFRVARFEMLRVGETPADYERPRIVLLTQLGALVDSTRLRPAPGMPAEQLELLKNVALHYPWSAPQYRYALALALNGHAAEAARQLQVIRAQHGEKTYRALLLQLEEKLAERKMTGSPARLP